MTIVYRANEIQGLSTDTKPTLVPTNSSFFETDTLRTYNFDGTVWVLSGIGGSVSNAELDGSIALTKLASGTAGKIVGFNSSTGAVEEQTAAAGASIGSGATLAALTPTAGQYAFCTSTGSGFVENTQYNRNAANTAWTKVGDISYGDASLGDVTISSATTISDSTNVVQYRNLTVNASQTLTMGTASQRPRKWIIFATESITVNGTINCSSRGGVGGAGGAGGAGGGGGTGEPAGHGTTGTQGANGSVATIGYNQDSNVGLIGGSGGVGGNNTSSGKSGGASQTVKSVSSAGSPSGYTEEENFLSKSLVLNNLANWGIGGNGGSGGNGGGGGAGGQYYYGGAGGTGGTGGTGGYGGGSLTLIAPTITFGGSALINCAGGAGSNGSNGSAGAPANGTAGAGGVFGVSSGTGSNGSTYAGVGGAPAGGGGAGGAGGAGRDGFVGIVGITIPSQVDLDAKSTAYIALRLVV